MPGFSLIKSFDSNIHNRFDGTLNNLLYLNDYKRKKLYLDNSISIGFTGYDSYPIKTFENDTHFIFIEGYLYGNNKVEQTTSYLLNLIEKENIDKIKKWLLEQDAEFILIFINKKNGKIKILNDALGRLPFYLYTNKDRVLISREIGFILDYETVSIDSIAIAEMLLFGYSLGDRTLYQDLRQINPSSLVTISDKSVSINRIHQLRIDEKPYENRSVKENALNLVNLFSEACKKRAYLGGVNIISLSGGLDSRAIAACFTANNLPFKATTYFTGDKRTRSEAEVAHKIMRVLKGDWDQINLKSNSGTSILKLLNMKRGMNNVEMGYILDYFNQIRERYGSNIVYFAGDGGDKIFPPLSKKKC